MTRPLRLALTNAVVLVACLAAAEAGLRVLDGYRLSSLRLVRNPGRLDLTQPGPGNRSVDALPRAAVKRYVETLPVAPGVSRAWFEVSPAPLKRSTLPPSLQPVAAALEHSVLPSSEMFKAWNTRFVQESLCSGAPFFRGFPGFALAYDPPEPIAFPRYRYLPNVTTPIGLVTNRFGWRGHDLSRIKPPHVVRLAFVGSSATVGSHGQPFSYVEYLEPWLNLWAEQEAPGVRFETINAAREGIGSTDIAAIVRQELPGVRPDLIVYFEGGNQFSLRSLMTPPPSPGPDTLRPASPIPFADRLAVAQRLDILLRRFHRGAGAEPRKPRYTLNWPAGVREDAPAPDSPDLPLDLPRIVRDLDDIRATARGIGARMVLTSFVWMVEDGMVVDPVNQAHFYESLNLGLWPATYADIRRMADFQNRVFSAYARTRAIPFVDYAARFPRDLQLFNDGVHLTADGDRLHAWVMLQLLIPILGEDLKQHRLPVADDRPPREEASEASEPRRVGVECTDYTNARELEGAVSLSGIRASDADARVSGLSPAQVITPAGLTAYAAEMPIAPGLSGPAIAHVRLRVREGHVGIGVLSRDRSRWVVQNGQGVSPAMVDVYMPVDALENAGVIMISNWAQANGQRSVVDVESVAILKLAGTR